MPNLENPSDQSGQEDIKKPIEPQAVLTPYSNVVGLPLQGFNAHLAVKIQPTFQLSPNIIPVFDLERTLKQNEYVQSAFQGTPVTGTTQIQIQTSPSVDYTYTRISIELGTARQIRLLTLLPSATGGVFIFDSVGTNGVAYTQTLHVLTRTTLPIFVPSGYYLEIDIVSSNSADGAYTVRYTRVERPVGLGPYAI